ncbi:MAG TPA: carboxymuconolactone decarboxylase family protein [Acidimicrobiales bacterium]|nr:carboxymuconolactone decarboxylase family protein [Acidimicrobiales bacterium]
MTATGWPTDWNELAALAREPVEQYVALHQLIDDSVDPVIVELCRLRIAGLIGERAHLSLRRPKAATAGLTEDKIAALAQWPQSPLFSAAERACLALAEQFCIGAFTVTDADVAAVLEHLDADQCYALVNGIWVMEALARMTLVMGVEPDPHTLGLVPANERSELT